LGGCLAENEVNVISQFRVSLTLEEDQASPKKQKQKIDQYKKANNYNGKCLNS